MTQIQSFNAHLLTVTGRGGCLRTIRTCSITVLLRQQYFAVILLIGSDWLHWLHCVLCLHLIVIIRRPLLVCLVTAVSLVEVFFFISHTYTETCTLSDLDIEGDILGLKNPVLYTTFRLYFTLCTFGLHTFCSTTLRYANSYFWQFHGS